MTANTSKSSRDIAQHAFPAGRRVQNAMGAARQTTAYNCFVSGVIDDSMSSIMLRATEAAETMRREVALATTSAASVLEVT